MSQATDPATGKPIPAVTEFMIEYDACMSCGLCAEVCPFDAIKMDHEFELATSDHPSMTVDKAGLDRPISYYQAIAPRFWEEVKDSALKKLQGNMKRRSGNIGIAPSFIGKAQKAAPAAAKPGQLAQPRRQQRNQPRRWPQSARICPRRSWRAWRRSARRMPAGGAAQPWLRRWPLPPRAMTMAPRRQRRWRPRRLRTAPSGGLPFSADNILGGVPDNTAMAEDKVERLKSIRSGNLAKRE